MACKTLFKQLPLCVSEAEVTLGQAITGHRKHKAYSFLWGLTPFIYIHSKQGLKQVAIQKLCGYGLNQTNQGGP